MKRLAVVAGAVALAGCGGGGDGTSACGFSTSPDTDLGAPHMGCIGAAAASDELTFTAPDDAAGGYVQVTIDAVAGMRMRATVKGGSGDKTLGEARTADVGAALSFFVAVAPGRRYRLAIADDGTFSAPYAYSLTTAFAPVPDPFEPNDDAAGAAPMAVAAPVQAFIFAGADRDMAAYEDFFRAPLAGGQLVTVRADSVPTDVALRVFLYDPTGVEMARVSTGHPGEALSMAPMMPATDGEYVVRVGLFTALTDAVAAGDVPPDHFTRPYQLSITQSPM
jgi:hypothetical protein